MVNIVYYGIVYMFFRKGAFIMAMPFVIRMFGGGMVVHLLVSMTLYKIIEKKKYDKEEI